MWPGLFYTRVIRAVNEPPAECHDRLRSLHADIMEDYLEAVERITAEQAAKPVAVGEDQRTLAQIVGHIEAWDRFATQSAGDILAGVEHPRMITSVSGFVETDGQMLDFPNVDAFNARQAKIDSQRSWETIQTEAIRIAETFYVLFAHGALLSAKRLEQTKMHQKTLRDGTVIENIRMGWVLWLIELEHLAVEHAAELGLQ
jgi:hypothetical protein